MNTPLFIAKRYLFSKKSVNAINVISGISTLGVLVGSAALVIILSVFNGFEQLILNMFSVLSPELRIEPAEGKLFKLNELDRNTLKNDPRVLHYAEVLQEKVLLRYGNNQYIGTLKGIGGADTKPKNLDELVEFGSKLMPKENSNEAIIGAAVHAYLGIRIDSLRQGISVYSPRKGASASFNPNDEFIIREIIPQAVMRPHPQFDDYLLSPLSFAQDVLGEHEELSAIEIDLVEGENITAFQHQLNNSLGPGFVVKNRGEQNPDLYRILNSEKWAIFLILSFVVVIAILNIIGSLSMLVIDKQKDILVLQSLGANPSFIKQIFFAEGMLISLIGCALGMLLGFLFCVLQINFGLIKMSGTDLITDIYPVALKGTDFVLVFGTVFVISAIASWVSSRLSLKSNEQKLE